MERFVHFLELLFLIIASAMGGAYWGGNPLPKWALIVVGAIALIAILLLEVGMFAGKKKVESYYESEDDEKSSR